MTITLERITALVSARAKVKPSSAGAAGPPAMDDDVVFVDGEAEGRLGVGDASCVGGGGGGSFALLLMLVDIFKGGHREEDFTALFFPNMPGNAWESEISSTDEPNSLSSSSWKSSWCSMVKIASLMMMLAQPASSVSFLKKMWVDGVKRNNIWLGQRMTSA